MWAFLGWYVIVQGLGTAAFILAAPCFRRLPDAGYGVSKSLGVLLCGGGLWLGTALGLLRNDTGGAVLVAATLAGTAALVARRRRVPPRRVVVASEAVFAAAFGGWCLLRSLEPAVAHTEQPMDLMLLTAVSTSATFPPADSWLAGYPVSYYYLGYWLMSALGFLAGQPPGVSYTIGQACWFGLLVVGCFGLGFNLVALAGGDRPGGRGPLAAGVLAAVTVAVAGNLLVPFEWLGRVAGRTTARVAGEWWWPSSRVVRDVSAGGSPIEVITEFPFFSYFLGDNHPHLLSMPFVVVALACALSLLQERGVRAVGETGEASGWPWPRTTSGGLRCLGLAMAAVGSLVALNTWDLPAALAVFALAASWPVSAGSALPVIARRAAGMAAAAVGTMVLLFFPYFLTAQSQVRGVLPNLFHPTSLGDFLIMFGAHVPGLVLLVGVAWREDRLPVAVVLRRIGGGLLSCAIWLLLAASWTVATGTGRTWMSEAAPGVERPLIVSLSRWITGWPVLVLAVAGLVVVATLVRARLSRGRAGADALTFALILTGVGLALAAAPELAYVHDVFVNRMNTVFKLYYQAWLYLGVAGSVGIVLAWRHGGLRRAGALVALATLGAGLVYPAGALRSAIGENAQATATLDALAWLDEQAPDDLAVIEWVRENTRPDAVIAQAPGESYRVDHSRVSTATGRPTLLGWQGHERQWRGGAFDVMAAGRTEALERIYTPTSADVLLEDLEAWRVDFVLVGPIERARYGVTPDHDALHAAVMDLAFEHGAVRLYRRRG